MHFREAVVTDIPQLQIIRNSVNENKLSDPGLISDNDYESFILTRGKGWVCEINESVVGFSIVDLEQKNVWALFVHPDFEAKGIGNKLHDLMLDWYFLQTKETIWLGTAPDTRAEQFYLAQGWFPEGIHTEKEVKFTMTFDEWTCEQLEPIAEAYDLTGDWTGFLTYGKEYPNKGREEKLHFDMELLKEGTKIAGLSTDINGLSKHPEKATINGTFYDNEIWFVKQYPYSHFADEFGNLTLAPNRKGHKIDYSGTYDAEKQCFKGHWTIRRWRLLGFIPVGRSRGSGEWEMWRKSAD